MDSPHLTHTNRWRLAVMMALSVTLTAMWLLASLLTTQALEATSIAPPTSRHQLSSLSASSVIIIGVAADLSGGAASLGWQEANSVQLAIDQQNAAGGVKIGGKTYTLALVTEDSKDDAAQAVVAANALLNAGAVAVVGHTTSKECLAAEPIYAAAGVAMISPSCTNPAVTQQGYNTTFRTVPHDGSPAVLLAKRFHALGLSKSAIVESGYLEPGDAYAKTFTALGGTITSRRTINDPSEFNATLTAIKAENPDVIVDFTSLGPPDEPAKHGELSQTAYGLGMTNVIIAWDTFGNDESVLISYADAAGTAAAQGDYAAMGFRRFQDMPGWTTFRADYKAANFSNEPNDPGLFGPFAYDAARITIAAIQKAKSTNPADIRSKIAATKNFKGVVGTYKGFDTHGDVNPQWAWLEQFQGWAIVQ